MVHLWKTEWRFLTKLKIEMLYDSSIPVLGIYPYTTVIQKDICTVDSFLKKLTLLRHLFIFIDAQLIYNVLVSAVQQGDSVIHTIHFFGILFHHGFSEDTEYSSLCYTVGPYCFTPYFLK